MGQRAEAKTGVPPRSPGHDHPAGIMDCQDAQQHGVQGAGCARPSTSFRVTPAGCHERNLPIPGPAMRPGSDERWSKRNASRTIVCRGRNSSQEDMAQPQSRLNRETAAKQFRPG